MKSKILMLSIVTDTVVLLFSGTSWARYTFQSRLANQQDRIEMGFRQGQITYGEYDRLIAEQDRIWQEIRRARRSHGIDRHEQRRIDRMIDRADEHIYQARHNRARQDRHAYRDRPHHRQDHRNHYHRPPVQGSIVIPLPPPPPFFIPHR